jgi:hypothetical protein
MGNLIETLVNTVAFFMAMRIAVVIGLLLFAMRLLYNYLHRTDFKRFLHQRKIDISRYIDLLKH